MATKTKKPRARKPRVKQPSLPSMEPPIIPAIEDAADNYYEVMTDRCKLSKEEDEKKDALIDAMKENKCDRYETQTGRVVTITGKALVKVKPKKASESNGDGEEE